MYSNANITEVGSLGSERQYVSIGSENSLALNRRQAIIWTNDGLVHWSIDASLGLNELTMSNISKILMINASELASFLSFKFHLALLLTHSCPVIPLVTKKIMSSSVREWVVARWHQANTLTNYGISLMRACSIHLRAIQKKNTWNIIHWNVLETYTLKQILPPDSLGQCINHCISLGEYK